MNIFKSVIRGMISESLLAEGPLDKMRNMGMPPEFAEWFYNFLPDYSKNHSHWYALQFSEMMHQFKDHIKSYKNALKRAQKEPRVARDMEKIAEMQFEAWKDAILDTQDDVKVVDEWAAESNINLSKKKEVNVFVGGENKSVPFSFAAAVNAAKEFFQLKDGKIFMRLPNGWYWLDRESNYCSIESKLMGHCGRADDPDATLFSLRDPQGLPHVTAEIVIDDDGDATVKQMKGKGNTTPDEKYHEMIYALLKNPKLNLIGYHASGRYGGDLTWRNIPEDVQEEIETSQENFNPEQEDDIESIMRRVEEEINEAIDETTDSVWSIMADPSSWDEYEEGKFYVNVYLSFYVTIPEELMQVLSEMEDKTIP